jgi:hypothetical protein
MTFSLDLTMNVVMYTIIITIISFCKYVTDNNETTFKHGSNAERKLCSNRKNNDSLHISYRIEIFHTVS